MKSGHDQMVIDPDPDEISERSAIIALKPCRILQSCPCISYLHEPFYATFAAAKYRQGQIVHPPRRINHQYFCCEREKTCIP